MAWYRAGTVSVANGSAVVTGANTDFVSNTQQGEAFLGPDGRVYEVAQVVSATQLTLGGNYQGASAGGQGYALMPTSSFARDLALGAAQLLNTFAAVRDGVGAGLFSDGSAATPGLRFAADQDTGLRRSGANEIAIVTGGVDRVYFSTVGMDVSGRMIAASSDPVGVPAPALGTIPASTALFMTNAARQYGILVGQYGNTGDSWMQSQRIDGSATAYSMLLQPSGGNLLVGTSTGSEHTFSKPASQGSAIARILSSAAGMASTAAFAAVGSYSVNGAGAALYLGKSTATDRSLNAAGTINASGADYAEYMRKAEGCGTIAKGDVCGVDHDGFLTRTWAAAVSYVVKSTDPSLVGGDVWAGHLGPKPDPIDPEPNAPGDAPPMPEADDPEALAAWREAVAAHTALVAAYPAAHAQWASDQAAYKTALATWEADLETARQCVDRIAFCGQVPVNVTGDFAVGHYIIAVANGSGIKAIAVAEADITFDQYRRRIGRVWAVRDSRAWVDVQHG